MNTYDNIPEFSVSEISGAVKQTIETTFGRVRVRGELGRVTIAQSGHMYATLKDEKNVLDAVCWRGSMSKMSIQPEEGLEVICTGRLTTYSAGKSSYQIVIESMEPAGEGALLKMLEERKKRLGAEGLFDADRKKPIPFIPQRIGVITSPTGAVIRDIIHRISDRFPLPILVWPVPVQGEAAAQAITNAINGMNTLPDNQRPDVLIIARGGGSLEDLMAFQDEAVVRAVAASAIPTISAIGHETDTTLIDYAADLRAPTPTGAAEMAVPVRENLMAQIMDDAARLIQSVRRSITDRQIRLTPLEQSLQNPARMLDTKQQSLDMVSGRLGGALERQVLTRSSRLNQISGRLRTPQEQLRMGQHKLSTLTRDLTRHGHKIGEAPAQKSTHLTSMLESLSFKNVLDRGFALIKTQDGQIIKQGADITAGDKIRITMQDRDNIAATID